MFAVTMQVAKAVLQKNANVRKSSEGALKGLSMQINAVAVLPERFQCSFLISLLLPPTVGDPSCLKRRGIVDD